MDNIVEIKRLYKKCDIEITTWYVEHYKKWRADIYIHYPPQVNSDKIHYGNISKLFNTREEAESYCLGYCKTKIDGQTE
jgi:hypothetical protein